MSHTLLAFNQAEFDLAHHMLAARVAYMMGRKSRDKMIAALRARRN